MRYPAVELLSGVLWVAAGVRFGFSAQTAWAIVMFYLLLLLAFIDLDTMKLPNPLVGALFACGLVGALFSQVSSVPAVPLVPLASSGLMASPLAVALLGCVVSAGVAFAIAGAYALIRQREGFGMGDVKLLGAIGVYLGLYGVLVLFVGSILGALYGVVGSRKKGGLGFKFPFGPFLSLAAVFVTLWGPQVWAWYMGFLR